MFLQRAYVHDCVCVCVCYRAHSVGFYLSLKLIVLHVCRSSASHHWPPGAINQESPLCFTKSQWAASITEPALPTHEYSPNETISYHKTGLEVAKKRKKKWQRVHSGRNSFFLSNMYNYIMEHTAEKENVNMKEKKQERKDHTRTLMNVLLFVLCM